MTNDFSGVQYSIENLIGAMGREEQREIELEVLLPGDYKGNLVEKENLVLKKVPFSTADRMKRIAFEHLWLPGYFSQHKFDLYHSPAYVLPRFSNLSSVVTIHDLLTLDLPEYCQWESVAYFRMCMPASIRKARQVIAVSHKVKSEIIGRWDIDPEKTHVIHHGVEPMFRKVTDAGRLQAVAAKYRLPERFLLFVGNLEPKKNLVRLLHAFACLRRNTDIGYKLVLAGRKGWKYSDLFGTIREYGLEKEVQIAGYVPRGDLPALYSLAGLFVFPSLYEGFGLPVLEAMACGTPVLTSDRGALPEVVGDMYPLVDPYDELDIADKLYLLLTNDDVRRDNIRCGLEQAKKFTWEMTAKRTLDVYRRALQKV